MLLTLVCFSQNEPNIWNLLTKFAPWQSCPRLFLPESDKYFHWLANLDGKDLSDKSRFVLIKLCWTCLTEARGDPTRSSSRPSPSRSAAASDPLKYSPIRVSELLIIFFLLKFLKGLDGISDISEKGGAYLTTLNIQNGRKTTFEWPKHNSNVKKFEARQKLVPQIRASFLGRAQMTRSLPEAA